MTDEQQLQNDIIKHTGGALMANPDMHAFIQKLTAYINELISSDFNKLIYVLYRLDISEKKLKQLLADLPGSDAGTIIVNMIIERQLQKIQSRKQYRQDDKSIAEEDKW